MHNVSCTFLQSGRVRLLAKLKTKLIGAMVNEAAHEKHKDTT
jgi:hypothetical protein